MQAVGHVAAQLLPLEGAPVEGGKGRPMSLSGASGFHYAETAEEISRDLALDGAAYSGHRLDPPIDVCLCKS
jgi:hypothetical protein